MVGPWKGHNISEVVRVLGEPTWVESDGHGGKIYRWVRSSDGWSLGGEDVMGPNTFARSYFVNSGGVIYRWKTESAYNYPWGNK
jgi:hypothetical protein